MLQGMCSAARGTVGQNRRRTGRVVIAFSAVLAAAGAANADPPDRSGEEGSGNRLADAVRFAERSSKALEKVKDYQAVFSKMEVVRGRPFSHTMRIKFREKPFSVYLRFHGNHDGREVIYVEGRNGGKLLAHETGLKSIVGTVMLDPRSPEAMSEGLYPITHIGMNNMLEKLLAQWKRDSQFDDVQVRYYPDAELTNSDPALKPMDCHVLESVHPRRRPEATYHMTRLWIDKKTDLPVRVEQYGFPGRSGGRPPLAAVYTYWNVKANVGLTDRDFDPRNPEYGF